MGLFFSLAQLFKDLLPIEIVMGSQLTLYSP